MLLLYFAFVVVGAVVIVVDAVDLVVLIVIIVDADVASDMVGFCC